MGLFGNDSSTLSKISKFREERLDDGNFYLMNSKYANNTFSGKSSTEAQLKVMYDMLYKLDNDGSIPIEFGEWLENMIADPHVSVSVYPTGMNSNINANLFSNTVLHEIFKYGIMVMRDVKEDLSTSKVVQPNKAIIPLNDIVNAVIHLKSTYKKAAGCVIVAIPSDLVDSNGNIIKGKETDVYDFDGDYYMIKPKFLTGFVSVNNGVCEYYSKESILVHFENIKKRNSSLLTADVDSNEDLLEIVRDIRDVNNVVAMYATTMDDAVDIMSEGLTGHDNKLRCINDGMSDAYVAAYGEGTPRGNSANVIVSVPSSLFKMLFGIDDIAYIKWLKDKRVKYAMDRLIYMVSDVQKPMADPDNLMNDSLFAFHILPQFIRGIFVYRNGKVFEDYASNPENALDNVVYMPNPSYFDNLTVEEQKEIVKKVSSYIGLGVNLGK